MRRTEDQVAFELLTSDVDNVYISYDEQTAMSETLANIVVAPDQFAQLNSSMIGEIQTELALKNLIKFGLVSGQKATSLGKIICQNFFTPEESNVLINALNGDNPPLDVVTQIELMRTEN